MNTCDITVLIWYGHNFLCGVTMATPIGKKVSLTILLSGVQMWWQDREQLTFAHKNMLINLQPAVNCQPSYCWGWLVEQALTKKKLADHSNWPIHDRVHLSMRDRNLWTNMAVTQWCCVIKLGGRKCMSGNAALHVARCCHSTWQLS